MLTLPAARSDGSVIMSGAGIPAIPLSEIYTWRITWTAVILGKLCGLVQLRVNPVLAVFKVAVTSLAVGGKYKRLDISEVIAGGVLPRESGFKLRMMVKA